MTQANVPPLILETISLDAIQLDASGPCPATAGSAGAVFGTAGGPTADYAAGPQLPPTVLESCLATPLGEEITPANAPPAFLPDGPCVVLQPVPPARQLALQVKTTTRSLSWIGLAMLFVLMVLLGLWLAQVLITWADRLTQLQPLLGGTASLLLATLCLLGLLGAWRQYRSYQCLQDLGDLRERLEQARNGSIGPSADELLRGQFRVLLERLAADHFISRAEQDDVADVLKRSSTPGKWIDRAGATLLRSRDHQVKELIEREARLVSVTTALSPSGPLDTVLVLWRNIRLILHVATIYGVRPGPLGRIRLIQRVIVSMVTAGLSEEVLQMLYAAYGPAVVEAAAQGARSFCDLVSKAGMMLATVVHPLAGGAVTLLAATGQGAAELAGSAAASISGPLLQGLLNGLLTLRIGLATQDECRLLRLTEEERRATTAGILSTFLGFFLSIRNQPAAQQPSVTANRA